MTFFRRVVPLLILGVSLLPGQTPPARPTTSLPYTPSLDLSSLDRTADPCTNFYQYSCGGWIRKNPIPADQARWNVYSKLANDNQQFLWGMLEQAAKGGSTRNPVERQIGDYFQSCMDEPAVEKAGSAPLQASLKSIMALTSPAAIPVLLAREHRAHAGSDLMFGFGASQDFSDATKVIAFVAGGGLGLPDRDYYTKTDAKSEETRKRYVQHVLQMFQLIGETPERAAADSKAVMTIETALAKSSLTRVEKRDPQRLFHKMNRQQLQSLTPAFLWDAYLKELGVSTLTEFNVTEPAYFQELDRQLKDRQMDEWKGYFRWHVLHNTAPYLSSKFVQANFDFYSKFLRGVSELQPRWKRCVQYVDRDLGEALGKVFVEKTFSEDAKQRTLAMTKEIERAMEEDLQQLTWMSIATKKQALEKLHSVVNKIGYPDKWRDYSSIQLSRTDFAGNVSRSREFEFRRDLHKIGRPVNRGEWGMTPPTVNAYYDPQMNDINFPAGVLQPPLFDVKLDEAPNYGNTGATIGHELTHGFDDEGRQFDAKGNLRDWWTKEDAEEFEKRAQCVVDQYAQYTVVDEIKINSKLTLGEDLADLGGTFLAYVAWRHATQNQRLMPVDGFTPDQRFFIGMAQWACGDERPESKRLNALTNPHSPEEYRINGVVSNLPEFGQAFGCKVGQPMMREKACKVW